MTVRSHRLAATEVKLQHQPTGQSRTAKRRFSEKRIRPVSLRVKLLIGFSILFSIVFAGSFYWFYSFTTDKIMSRLRLEMRSTLRGAAAGVDIQELMLLYANGQRNAAGFSDDSRYHNQMNWFETVHSIEPRAWLYSYVVGYGHQNRRIGEAAVQPDQLEIVYLVDLWANYDPSKAARFLESDRAGIAARRVLREGTMIEEPQIYTDQWGSWLSAFAPLRDQQGKIVAVLGLDIQADYVLQVQREIRSRVVVSFVITYAVLFLLIYVLSGILTERLSKLTHSAERIGAGSYGLDLSNLTRSRFPDEMNTLALVFETMVNSIRTREWLIREGKKVEDEMRLALQQEREVNELKSRFVSMVSHELRTPLTVIRTSLELLERYGHLAPEDKKQEYFQRSRAAVQTMNQMLEDVLTLGKAEVGKLEFNPVPIDLQEFCEDIVGEVKLESGGNHMIRFSHAGRCREAYLDPKLLRSILVNLLSNAIKYSPGGSMVEFSLMCLEDAVVFEVRDRGIGIPQSDQPRLFELFHRASNVNAIRGTGLGLAIVKQCVARHGGQVTFTSQESVGTTFRVRLPLRCATLEPSEADRGALRSVED